MASTSSLTTRQVIELGRRVSKPYRIANGKALRLKDVDPGDTGDLKSEDKPRAKEALHTGIAALAAFQDVLYAQDRWSLLLVFQAMDAAGKDGTIKHVMSGVNPQGCQVSSFKSPTSLDLVTHSSGNLCPSGNSSCTSRRRSSSGASSSGSTPRTRTGSSPPTTPGSACSGATT
jgi:hypothetical protein